MSDHGSRGWEATANGWRCTECRQEVVGPIDVAIDDAHVCTQPARSRAEAEKAITAVLAKHRFRRHTGVQQRDGSVRKQPQGCECWHWEGDEPSHRAHVASALADLMAEAWHEGAETVYEDWSESEGPFFDDVENTFSNPYRVADTEGDR